MSDEASAGDDESRAGSSHATTVVLVADRRQELEAIRGGLAGSGLVVVGEADTPENAVEAAVRLRPDVVIVHSIGSEGAWEMIERITRFASGSRVLVLAPSNDGAGVIDAIRAGASGYVHVDGDLDELGAAVRAAATGACPMSPEHSEELCAYVRRLGRSEPSAAEAREIRDALTKRELQVLLLLPDGESNAEIGQSLGLSEHTVRNHVARILTKLRLENRTQAAVKAVRSGLAGTVGAEIGIALAHEGGLLTELVVPVLGG